MIPTTVSHLTAEDTAELTRLLLAFARGDEKAAADWLVNADVYDLGGKPIDMLRRDELGMLRVISYLKDNAPCA